MSSITRKVFTALVASAAAASVASAQVSYTVTSQFTTTSGLPLTCNNATFMAVSTCTGGGFSLSFTGNTSLLLGTPTTASLGEFLLTGSGSVVVPPDAVFLDILVTQTSPELGTGGVIGTFSGMVTTNSSQLIFTPDDASFGIGPVTYSLILEPGGSRSIAYARPTSLEARISTVPEPATVFLMGSGLAALGFFGARRKKN